MNTAFKLKHNIATLISNFRDEHFESRVAMFHDVKSSKDASSDLYTVSIEMLSGFIDLAQYTKKIEHFAYQDLANPSTISITFDDGYLSNYSLAAPELFKKNAPFTIFMISDFVEPEHSQYLNKEHLRELITNPLVTIGAHGKTHRPLLSMPIEEAREELRISKMKLEDILGQEVKTMSFPHGSFNSDLLNIAKELGYSRCGTSVPLGNSVNNAFKINRQCIYSCDTKLSSKQKIKGQWDWVWKNSSEDI